MWDNEKKDVRICVTRLSMCRKQEKICRKKGITVNDIRDFMNFSCSQSIYRWFHGQALPSMDNFYALSLLLGISLERFLANDSGIIFVPGREEHAFLCVERLEVYRQCVATI